MQPFAARLPDLRLALAGPADGLPFTKLCQLLATAGERFRLDVIAKLVEPGFNQAVQAMPNGKYEDKQHLCKWVNSVLSDLGLSVNLPDEPGVLPARMLAGTGSNPATGRFEFEYVTPDGSRKRLLRQTLPEHFRIVPALTRRTPGSKSLDALAGEG